MAPKVLLVDDEKSILMMLEVNFRAAGFDVVTATSGASALEMAVAARPDAVVLDLRLPDRDGWWVVDEFRKIPEKASVPIVVCSAHASPSTLARARDQGLPYVTKPFSPARLVAVIGEMLRGAAPRAEDVDPE